MIDIADYKINTEYNNVTFLFSDVPKKERLSAINKFLDENAPKIWFAQADSGGIIFTMELGDDNLVKAAAVARKAVDAANEGAEGYGEYEVSVDLENRIGKALSTSFLQRHALRTRKRAT